MARYSFGGIVAVSSGCGLSLVVNSPSSFAKSPSSCGNAVNVASVPQRSPFRYPGGKTWLVPQVRAWLSHFKSPPALLLEPFAGGGIVGLTAAAENMVDRVLMVELDPNVAAVWEVIIKGDAEALVQKILKFKLTLETVQEELARNPKTDVNRAFQTILRNRVQRGGIMASGAGLMKNGEKGKGIGSRWYASTLARRIRDIQNYRSRIDFVQGDGFQVLAQHAQESETVLFIDPPYTAGGKSAGSRLYPVNSVNHEQLFTLAANHAGDILLTYDNCAPVVDLSTRHRLVTKPVARKSTHNAVASELLISRDLAWVV